MKLNIAENINISGFSFKIPNDHECSFSNCIFSSLSRSTPILADSISSLISFEECLFDSIKGDKEGGCIHVNCSSMKTKIFMNKVIANKCETENREGSFAHLTTKDSIDMKDVIMSMCAPIETSAHYGILANCPKANHEGGNITDSLAYSDLLSFNAEESTSKWCQFKTNVLKQHGVVVFQVGTHILQYSTVIDNINNQPSTGGAIVFTYQAEKLTVLDSYFMRNTGSYVISSRYSSCTVFNCVVDNWYVNDIASSSGIETTGTPSETSVVFPIRLKQKCETKAGKIRIQMLLAASAFITLLNLNEQQTDQQPHEWYIHSLGS